MSRVNPQLTSFDDSYQIEKFSRQVADGPDQSTYKITDTNTGAVAVYTAQHVELDMTKTEVSDVMDSSLSVPAKKNSLRKIKYPSGLTAVVKKLTLTDVEGDDHNFPAELALKCYVIDRIRPQLEKLPAVIRSIGEFSLAFTSKKSVIGDGAVSAGTDNEKYFFLSPWYGDKDVMRCIMANTREGALPTTVDSKQLVIAFWRFLQTVPTIHELLGGPVIDIKPENLFPVYNRDNVLIGFKIVDLEGCFAERVIHTPYFLQAQDMAALVKHQLKPGNYQTDMDYGSLSLVLGAMAHGLISDACVDYDRHTLYHRRGSGDYIEHSQHVFMPKRLAGREVFSRSQQVLMDMMRFLSEKRANPVLTPTPELSQQLLLLDIECVDALLRQCLELLVATRDAKSESTVASAATLFSTDDECGMKIAALQEARDTLTKITPHVLTFEGGISALRAHRESVKHVIEALSIVCPTLAAQLRDQTIIGGVDPMAVVKEEGAAHGAGCGAASECK